jgi:curli biogenesis system outer membrane secretion channel CsgG
VTQTDPLPSPGIHRAAAVLLFLATLLAPAQTHTRTYTLRGKVKSISATEITLVAVDIPLPQTFLLSPEARADLQTQSIQPNSLIQVTFSIAGDIMIASALDPIRATPVNLPRFGAASSTPDRAPTGLSSPTPGRPTPSSKDISLGAKGTTPTNPPASAKVTLGADGKPAKTFSTAAVGLGKTAKPRSTAPSTVPINLAADADQLALLKAPTKHQSGVRNPIRLAILDFTPTPAVGATDIPPDLTPDLVHDITDQLTALLQNDAIFTILDRETVAKLLQKDSLTDPAQLAKLAASGIDAILTGDLIEDVTTPPDPTATPHRRKLRSSAYPDITLNGRLLDTRTAQIIGPVHASASESDPDRPTDHTPPLLRAVSEAVVSLASALDPDYPSVLDPRTFVTVTSSQPGLLTVAFPSPPSLPPGAQLKLAPISWFTRDPTSEAIQRTDPDTLGTLTITRLDHTEVTGTYSGTLPTAGQTVRLTQ